MAAILALIPSLVLTGLFLWFTVRVVQKAGYSGLNAEAWLSRYPPPMAADPTLVKTVSTAVVAGQPAVRLTGVPVVGGAGIPWHYRAQFRQDGWMMAITWLIWLVVLMCNLLIAAFVFGAYYVASLDPNW